MPAIGADARKMNEGRAQLLWGAGIAALLAMLFLGKPLAGVPTPIGIDLGDATILAIDALWLAAIVWKSASPPTGRDAWLLAAYLPFPPLMHFLANRHSHTSIVVTADVVVAIVGVIGGLSIVSRRLLRPR